MKKVLVLDNCYPSENNFYGNVFVHVRVKEYIKELDVSVAGYNRILPENYVYEGVPVRNFKNQKSFIDYVMGFDADIVIIHFLDYWMIRPIAMKLRKPLIIWVHGHEVLKWYRRLFNFSFSLDFLKYIIRTEIQSLLWNGMVRHSNNTRNVVFVFISDWMKRMAEADSRSRFKNYEIIPNPIDTELFTYHKKDTELRKKILLIRPFTSNKYANDIAIKGIIELSKTPLFSEFSIAIYGDGKDFEKLTKPLVGLPNVQLNKKFIEQKNIPGIHAQYGVFLCPTRQDAQGVSMCEAMSSGLVPVTSNNTAIPEFVENGQTGLFADTPKQIAVALLELYNNPDLFLRLSENASSSIIEKCSLKSVISRELELINRF